MTCSARVVIVDREQSTDIQSRTRVLLTAENAATENQSQQTSNSRQGKKPKN